jgi:hypothetical protein
MKPIDGRNVFIGRYDAHGDGVAHHYTAEEMHNEDVAHEHSDINIRAIVWSAVVLAAVGIGAAILMYFLFNFFEREAKSRDPKLSPLALPAVQMPTTTNATPEFGDAPEPRLLTNEPTYLRDIRQREQQILRGYGWVDQGGGVTRIPIDEAKKLLLERGLPVRPEPVTDPRVGTHAPAYGEPSSGRTILSNGEKKASN